MKTTEKILKAIEELENEAKEYYLDYKYYGIRFESRHNLEAGYVLENSKTNRGREDSREFPIFGTPEYDEMEELDGTCAYFIYDGEKEEKTKWLAQVLSYVNDDSDDFAWYLVGCERLSDEEGEDDNEIIMKDATIIKKI